MQEKLAEEIQEEKIMPAKELKDFGEVELLISKATVESLKTGIEIGKLMAVR